MADNWGDHCTYCGVALSGTFPRKCENGHYTYDSPVSVGIALQPVGRNGLLCVQRGINPYKGQFALPGGFMDNHESPEQSAVRELCEETGLTHKINDVTYFRSAVGGSHHDKDSRCHVMHFFVMPVIDKVPVFENEEVQKLEVFTLSDDRKNLKNAQGETITLCFSTHHDAAVNFLKSSPDAR